MRLDLAGVSADIDARPIVTDVNLTAGPGEFVALVGPNGSGKSTLLRTVYRSLRPSAGVVSLDGEDLWRMRPRQAARRRATLPQHNQVTGEFSVAEVVAVGRTCHRRPLDRETAADRTAIGTALERVGMAWAADRPMTSLSGGERQRVLDSQLHRSGEGRPVQAVAQDQGHVDAGGHVVQTVVSWAVRSQRSSGCPPKWRCVVLPLETTTMPGRSMAVRGSATSPKPG
ncbi:ABC transporter ATP-binding protein [Actinomadura viridis]|uniref:ABC transporter ATP-binding protein n=1 Tax=Actinomadura viridis TaxID=58110 RepID=UPI0036A8D8D2